MLNDISLTNILIFTCENAIKFDKMKNAVIINEGNLVSHSSPMFILAEFLFDYLAFWFDWQRS